MGVNSCGQLLIDQGNFFNTGLLNWDTTAKTANFTAVNGNGYFVNTTSAAITVTLPAGSAGDFIGVSDYASTANTNAITISPNGTDKINGTNDDFQIVTKGIAVSLLYVDSTRGWKAVASNSENVTGASFITATGGTITTNGDFKIHAFTGPGTFTITCLGQPTNTVEYLVVAGGGSGGKDRGGGGGAGGTRHNFPSPSTGGLPVSATSYPITVGAGGAGDSGPGGNNGSNSVFSSITSTGGGKAGDVDGPKNGSSGGSGGGAAGGPGPSGGPGTVGAGNTPPVSPPQGFPGGTGTRNESLAGGGGGASAAGGSIGPSDPTSGPSGPGGDGVQIPQVPTSYGSPAQYFGGGGGGGYDTRCGGSPSAGGCGGLGGGSKGNAGSFPSCNPSSSPGVANTGGGSGGGGQDASGTTGNGGSGIVIIRYKFQ